MISKRARWGLFFDPFLKYMPSFRLLSQLTCINFDFLINGWSLGRIVFNNEIPYKVIVVEVMKIISYGLENGFFSITSFTTRVALHAVYYNLLMQASGMLKIDKWKQMHMIGCIRIRTISVHFSTPLFIRESSLYLWMQTSMMRNLLYGYKYLSAF